MTPIDFFIIYLACGAPFGVYYFLQNPSEIRFKFFWLKTVFVFFLWIPFAVLLLHRNNKLKINSRGFGKTSSAKPEKPKILRPIQKQIEKILLESDLMISIYEFREIAERYIGLTLAGQNTGAKSFQPEAEIYRAAQAKNVELGSICLNRRNRKRLLFHQTEARKDFLRFIEKLSEMGANRDELADSSFKFAQTLNDLEAFGTLERIFAHGENDWRQSVKRLEKDLWKPEEETRKPQPATAIPIQLSNMSATISLRRKD